MERLPLLWPISGESTKHGMSWIAREHYFPSSFPVSAAGQIPLVAPGRSRAAGGGPAAGDGRDGLTAIANGRMWEAREGELGGPAVGASASLLDSSANVASPRNSGVSLGSGAFPSCPSSAFTHICGWKAGSKSAEKSRRDRRWAKDGRRIAAGYAALLGDATQCTDPDVI